MKKEKYNIAVVGATGAVGQVMLEILAERSFPVDNVYALASKRSVGESAMFGHEQLPVEDVETFDFAKADIALFSAGGDVAKKYAEKVKVANCVMIDNSSAFRYEKDVPLVVPEINPEAVAQYKNRHIIANPNCSTIQMVVALKPIQDEVGINRVVVSTYQSVSGSGKKGIAELANQTAELLNGHGAEPEFYSKQIAFNVIPQVDKFEDNGFTREEMKMVWETQKILGDESIKVNATAVRVPVFYGHSESVTVEMKAPLTVESATEILREAKGVVVIEDKEDYPTAVNEGTSQDAVYVGRIREDISKDNSLNFWVVSDNIRKGAALNAVQIAEVLVGLYA